MSCSDYYPYGKTLRQFVSVDEKFLTTQHERDAETGLDCRGARFYDSDVARFLSLDPLAADYPSLSDYSYVAGNPVLFIDPTGKSVETKYIDYDTGELLKDVDDGSDENLYVNKEQFEWTLSQVESYGGDLEKKEDAELFTATYKNLNVDGNTLFQTDYRPIPRSEWKDPMYSDPAGGCFVPVELYALEFVAVGKVLGAAFSALKYAAAGSAAVTTGAEAIDVYRVYGQGSKAAGYSWTPINPNNVNNFRNVAGLPNANAGSFVIEGTVNASKIIKQRAALPLEGNTGGLLEYIINPVNVTIKRVSGANPNF